MFFQGYAHSYEKNDSLKAEWRDSQVGLHDKDNELLMVVATVISAWFQIFHISAEEGFTAITL